MRRLLGRDVKLVAELAQVGDADAKHARVTDVDFASRAERECLVGKIRRRQRLQQLARARALDIELAIGRRHVGHERMGIVRDIALHPGFGVAKLRVGHDDEILLVSRVSSP